MKGSDLSAITSVDTATASVVRDAARAISGIGTSHIATISSTLAAIDKTRFVDPAVMHSVSQALDSFRPIVAPQMDAALAESLKHATTATAAFKAIELPTFNFAKTLDALDGMARVKADIARAVQTLQMPTAFTTAISPSAARRATPPALGGATPAVLAARAGDAIQEAVILAKSPAAETLAEDALGRHTTLPPATRRELLKDVANAIAAFGMLVAILEDNGDLELASSGLFLLTLLVSVYLRVSRRDD